MALEATTFRYVRDLVYQDAGIVVDEDKGYLVESRLRPLAIEKGLTTVDALVSAAQTAVVKNGLHSRMVEAMTTNETSFFRDVHPFEALRTTLLPAYAAKRPGRGPVIWCAACSTGQEPYSVAMLLREHFPALAATARIVATDISDAVLARARSGVYRQIEVNRGLPAAYLVKYFERQDLEWQLKPEVRNMVSFSPVNLLGSWPLMGTVDFVFLRNILIYFDVETKRKILGRVRKILAPDGALFLGAAETTFRIDDNYERAECGKTIYYRSGALPVGLASESGGMR